MTTQLELAHLRLGADVALAVVPRDLEGAEAAADELPGAPTCLLGADLTDGDDLDRLETSLRSELGHLDAALHAVAFAPAEALNGVLGVPSAAVELAFRTSTYSYASVAGLLSRLAPPAGGILVGLDFDSSRA